MRLLSEEHVLAILETAELAAAAYDRRSDHLRRAIYSAVDVLKLQGWPPERIIIQLRKVMEASPGARRFPQLADPLTEWCLARYYASPNAADPLQS